MSSSAELGMKLILLGVVSGAGGCDGAGGLLAFLRPARTNVELVNRSDFPVDVELFISDEQDVPRAVLTSDLSTKLEFDIGAGETTRFSRNCNDLQAIIVSDADLRIVGGIGPETESGVLRDGDDFGCRDTIRFTFDHSDVILDFDVTVSVRSNATGGR